MQQSPSSAPWPWLIALAALTLAGGWIRFEAATATGLWLDEILAIFRSQRDPFGTSWTSVVDGQHGPLHHTLLAFSDRISQSELSYRLPAILAGAATIPVAFVLGTVVCSPAAGFLAASLLAVSPLHVYCSAEARPAVLLVLAFGIGLLAVLRLVRRPGTPWPQVVVAITLSLLLLASGQGIWYAAVLLLVLAVPTLQPGDRRIARLGWLVGHAAWAAVLVVAIYGGYARGGSDPASSPPLTGDLIARLFQPLVSGFTEARPASPVVVWSATAAAGVGAVALVLKQGWRVSLIIVTAAVAGFLLPLIPLYVFDWGIRAKYVMTALVPLLVLLGAAAAAPIGALADQVGGTRHWLRPLCLALCVTIAAAAAAGAQRGPLRIAVASRADWRAVAQVIKETVRPGQLILASNDWPVVCLGWYLERMGVRNEVRSAGESVERAAGHLVGRADAILVTGGYHANGGIRAWMDRFHPIYSAQAESIRVYFYPDRHAYVLRGLPPSLVTRDEQRLWEEMGGVIDLGSQSAVFLLDGWEGVEHDRTGTPFRWIIGRQCTVYLPLQRRQVVAANIQLRPFDPLAGRLSVEVSVNGSPVAVHRLRAGWNTLDVPLADAPWQYGGNLLQFSFSAAARPSDVLPGASDARPCQRPFGRSSCAPTGSEHGHGIGPRRRNPAMAALTPLTSIVSRVLDRTLRRNQYGWIWNWQARSLRNADLAVAGSIDDAEWQRSGDATSTCIRELTRTTASDVVLEIGCGTGRVGVHLARHCAHWIGTDVSGRMLAHARRRLAGSSNVTLTRVDGSTLAPIASESVDVVYCTAVFMHIDEWDRFAYIEEAWRVLRPGGRLYVDNLNLMGELGWEVFRTLPRHSSPTAPAPGEPVLDAAGIGGLPRASRVHRSCGPC